MTTNPTTLSVPAYLAAAMDIESAEADQVMASQNFNPQMRRLTTGTAAELGQEPGPGEDVLMLAPGFAVAGPMGASAAIPPVRKHGRP